VEQLTEVKIRTNLDREPGEEAVPEWVFEEGVVFLPEELQHGMQLMNRHARRCFREENRDLLGIEYWEDVQRRLLRGEVPELSMFPEGCKLPAEPVLDESFTDGAAI
jgi:isocitrate dehydrogenase kinase/phosphatase